MEPPCSNDTKAMHDAILTDIFCKLKILNYQLLGAGKILIEVKSSVRVCSET